jgi:hypothetical protein
MNYRRDIHTDINTNTHTHTHTIQTPTNMKLAFFYENKLLSTHATLAFLVGKF